MNPKSSENLTCSCGCNMRLSGGWTEEQLNKVFDMKQMKLRKCIEKEEKLKMKREPLYASARLSTNANPMLKYLTGLHTKPNNSWKEDEIGITSGYRQKLVSETHDIISNGTFDQLSLLKLALDDLLEKYRENYEDIADNNHKPEGMR